MSDSNIYPARLAYTTATGGLYQMLGRDMQIAFTDPGNQITELGPRELLIVVAALDKIETGKIQTTFVVSRFGVGWSLLLEKEILI